MISHGKIVKRTWKWSGKKRVAYLFDIEVDGKRVRRQFASKQEAKDELDKFRDEIKHPTPIALAAIATPSFGALVDKFLAQKSRAKTAGEFERVSKILKLELGADTPVTAITSERISEYKAARLAVRRGGRPLTSAAINRPMGLLRTILRQALKWKMISEVPEIDFEEEHEGRVRYLEPNEAHRLLAACRKSRNAALADLVEFLMFMGVRRGEALGLTWDKVDQSRGVVILEGTKNGKWREVPLSTRASAVLARRWAPGAEGLVFGSRNWNAFRQAWKKAVLDAGIRNLKLHDLRHAYASWLVQRGRPLQEVKELLGHSDIKMAMRYSHLAPQQLRAAVASLDDVLPVASVEPAVNDDSGRKGGRKSQSAATA